MRLFSRASFWWLVFYVGVLPWGLSYCLDWLNRPSDWWVACGVLCLLGLLSGVAISLYRASRVITRRLLGSSSTKNSSQDSHSSSEHGPFLPPH